MPRPWSPIMRRCPPLSEPALPAKHAQAALARAVQYAEAADAPHTLRATGATGTPSSLGAGTRASPPAGGARDGRAYLAAHAGTHAVATLRRRLVTIARAHRQAGIEG